MKSFLDKSRAETELEEILSVLIRKTKELYGDEIVLSEHQKILMNKGVKFENDQLFPAWKEYLLSNEFNILLKKVIYANDSRNNSKT